MPTLDRVVRHDDWLDGGPGVHLMDLAYEEYVARDRDGAATAHVESYWAHLARTPVHKNEPGDSHA